jgi:Zn-dependent protease with chaperone function
MKPSLMLGADQVPEQAMPGVAATPVEHASACWCSVHARRRFGRVLAAATLAPGAALAAIPECRRSKAASLVPADSIEGSAVQQYRQMLQQYAGKRALAPDHHPQLERLRTMAERMVPFTPECNERAKQWKWEVNLIGSNEVNAFCMPGGKIGFYYGILSRLQLSDDEVAAIMGHEIAHALLEHAREQTAKSGLTTGALRLGAALFGLGSLGDLAAQGVGQLASLNFSRTDESEADALGLVLSARAGYDPRAGVTLWEKMMASSGGGAPPKILSTHPTNADRIRDIQGRLDRLMPVYQAAAKPSRTFGPPKPPATTNAR